MPDIYCIILKKARLFNRTRISDSLTELISFPVYAALPLLKISQIIFRFKNRFTFRGQIDKIFLYYFRGFFAPEADQRNRTAWYIHLLSAPR